MDNSINVGGQRQRRVLPSRSRRGGPGIGSCEVDLLILDTQKRKAESEPLVPANTPFLLTTNPSLVPSTSSSNWLVDEPNTNANAQYFHRTEVLKAYKEQQIIQTPEFSALSEHASVSGRFRPRGSDDESADTSDAAYEKRHRKYESFEKRQRLREKEKLKHEQYKLKERIEQLRVMDSAAFLTLPSSSFPPVPGRSIDTEDDASITSLSEEHVNGTTTYNYNEGERRRKEMLDVALALEERYRTLLPPERKGVERDKKGGGLSNFSERETVGRETLVRHDDDEFDIDADEPIAEADKKREKIKLKIPARLLRSSPQTPRSATRTHAGQPLTMARTIRKPKFQLSPSAHPPRILSAPPPFDSSQTSTTSPVESSSFESRLSSSVQPYIPPTASRPTTPRSISIHVDEFLPQAAEPFVGGMESVSQARRRGRSKPHPLYHRPSISFSKSHALYPGTCLLLVAAYRNSDTPKARKTQRHVTAFGCKVPSEMEVWRDFEVPAWLIPKDDVDVEGLEVESHLLAGVDGDTSDLLETSVVDVKDASVNPATSS